MKLSSRMRRNAGLAFAVLAISGMATFGLAESASAQGAIPCKLDDEGHCHKNPSNGGGQADPWVANLFYNVDTWGHDQVYRRWDGTEITPAYANNLARNLGYRLCIPVKGSKKQVSIAVCQD